MDRKLKGLFRLEKFLVEKYMTLGDLEREEVASLYSEYQEIAGEVRRRFDDLFDLTGKLEGKYPCEDCVEKGIGCCRNCAGVVGYYSALDILKARHTGEDWHSVLLDCWGEKGFLMDGGCALPQSLRSYNCTRQICSRYRGGQEGMDESYMDEIKGNIKDLGDVYSKIEDLLGCSDFPAF